MTGYVIRRILWLIPVLWAVATITFVLMHAIPGGPFDRDKPLPEQIQRNLAARYNLDEPLWKQYGLYLWGLPQGDLGLTFRGDREVSEVLREGFFVTAQIAILALLLAVTVGIVLGALSALNHNGPLDYLGVIFATVGASVPNFIMAVFLSIFFAVNLQWFKLDGWGGPEEFSEILNFGAYEWDKMVIPVVALATLPAAFIARVTRASMLEVLNQDYVRTARAKGLREYTVVVRHAVKNALIPVLTVIGPIAATLLSGSFIIESMFAINGIGREFVDAVIRRDYGMIMGSTLFFATLVVFANLIVDLLYAVVDPRIRYG